MSPVDHAVDRVKDGLPFVIRVDKVVPEVGANSIVILDQENSRTRHTWEILCVGIGFEE